MGGGGSSAPSGPQQQTVVQTNIPEYARPYVESMLGATQQQLFNTQQGPGGETQITGIKGYTPYGAAGAGMGPTEQAAAQAAVAGFSPLQQQAQQGIAGLQVPGQFGAATEAAMLGTQAALGAGQYQPGFFTNQFRAPASYRPSQFSMVEARAPELTQYQMGGPERVGTQTFAQPGAAEAYMSPYMQSVVAQQQREAMRQSGIAGTQLAGQATQAGAFGGSRYGLQEAERQRNLATQLGDIQATGSQAAFQQAQQQFNAEQQARLQAALANQQAGINVGGQNLQALLGVQQLGAGQSLQAQLANQQALQAAQQAAEQSRQFGYGQGMTSAQQRAQYGLAAQQAAEQSRQFGAGLGLQGAQAGIQGASQLAGIGAQQLGAQQGIYGLQAQTGAQQQAQQQQVINQMIQNYATAQQYPQQQLAFMNAMLRGLPLQTATTQTYQAAPSAVSQIAGLGTAGLAGYKLANMKEGGKVQSDDGIVGLGLNKALS